jgi:uncharacterized repeat protein (TIGR03803 family)
MPQKRPLSAAVKAAGALAVMLFLANAALASGKYKVLHNFGLPNDGIGLWGSLLLDSHGNVYGTTFTGGSNGQGTVFELSPGSKVTWSETVLHSFPSFEYDGAGLTSTLVWDAVGNLYGTTEGGGTHHSGTAFELAQASWAETILYNFCADSGCSDGGSPSANMIMDQTGNLYGTAGVVFELSSGSDGWEETTAPLKPKPGLSGPPARPTAGVKLGGNLEHYSASVGGVARSTALLCGAIKIACVIHG